MNENELTPQLSSQKNSPTISADLSSYTEKTEKQNRYYWRWLVPLSIVMMSYNIISRFYYRELYNYLKTYPSDIWYIYNNYGYFLINRTIFNIEYPMPMLMLFKILAKCAELLPGTSYSDKYNVELFAYNNWIIVNSLFLGIVGLIAIWLAHRLNCKYFHLPYNAILYGFVLAPSFLFFSIYNYDLIPIACMLASLYSYLEGDDLGSFSWAGLGFAFKIYPGVMLPIFWLCLPNWERRWKCTLAFLLPWSILNIPYMVLDFKHWLHPYLWQAQFDNSDQSGRIIYLLTQNIGKIPALALLGGIMFAFMLWVWRRRPDNFRTNALWLARCSLALLAIFVMVKNVFSPQYLLWMTPFIALCGGIPSFGLYYIVECLGGLEVLRMFYWQKNMPEYIVFCRFARDIAVSWVFGYTVWKLLKTSNYNHQKLNSPNCSKALDNGETTVQP